MPASYSTKFAGLSRHIATASGTPAAFLLAVLITVGWLISGPFFHFSETWQLFINTGTTIVTFLMVFLIQNAQNRDTAAIQIKLDELIRAVNGAHNALIDLEELDGPELDRVRERYKRLAAIARQRVQHGEADTTCPEIEERCDDRQA